MRQLFRVLQAIDRRRYLIIAVVPFVVVGILFYGVERDHETMALLYGGLGGHEITAISDHLQSRDIPFDIRADETQVFAPRDRVGEVRLDLAGKKLPSGGGGHVLIETLANPGSMNEPPDNSIHRALEAELADTIKTIDIVSSATVHLVLPQSELRQHSGFNPSATIFLKMNDTERLNSKQVETLIHFLKVATPDLSMNNISIIDNSGELNPRVSSYSAPVTKANMERKAQREREATVNRLIGLGQSMEHAETVRKNIPPGPGTHTLSVPLGMDPSNAEINANKGSNR